MMDANTQGACAHCWGLLLARGAHQHPSGQAGRASSHTHCHKPPLTWAAPVSASKSASTQQRVGGPQGDPPAPSRHTSTSCLLRQHDSPMSSFQPEASFLSSSQ